MKAYIKERTLQVGRYIASSHETIRAAAKVFNLSKSTVHNDLAKRLNRIDKDLYSKVKWVLDKNFSEKHIRGGNSTKQKYAHLEK